VRLFWGVLTPIAVILLGIAVSNDHGAATASRDPYRVRVVQTNAELSQRLTRLRDAEFGSRKVRVEQMVSVDPGVRYQTVQGFGAAMTDTSAWLIERKTSASARATLMSRFFGADGIRLNVVRVPIGASDFTRDGRPYTYDDRTAGQTDPGLTHFSIAHDSAYILPALRETRTLDPAAEFLGSPWTAPAWMKTNHSLANRGDLGRLRSSAYRPWSEYLVKFIQAYERGGVPIHAVTVQNEPRTATSYPGMNFSAASEKNWITHDLTPALAKAHEHPSLYAGDLGWGPHSTRYLKDLASGPAAYNLDGIAWHCYFGAPSVMSDFHAEYPRLRELVDECSPGGPSPTPTTEIVIASMRHWASIVALWNLALDQHGGPVQPPNRGCPRCLGLATINEHSGEISLTRSYYQLGQASAFVKPGAQRIASTHFVTYSYPHTYASVVSPGLDDVAFRNPDGAIVLVAYNNSATAIRFGVTWQARTFTHELPPQATVTFVWNQTHPS
jgi:glucosylceramidase